MKFVILNILFIFPLNIFGASKVKYLNQKPDNDLYNISCSKYEKAFRKLQTKQGNDHTKSIYRRVAQLKKLLFSKYLKDCRSRLKDVNIGTCNSFEHMSMSPKSFYLEATLGDILIKLNDSSNVPDDLAFKYCNNGPRSIDQICNSLFKKDEKEKKSKYQKLFEDCEEKTKGACRSAWTNKGKMYYEPVTKVSLMPDVIASVASFGINYWISDVTFDQRLEAIKQQGFMEKDWQARQSAMQNYYRWYQFEAPTVPFYQMNPTSSGYNWGAENFNPITQPITSP